MAAANRLTEPLKIAIFHPPDGGSWEKCLVFFARRSRREKPGRRLVSFLTCGTPKSYSMKW